MCVRTVHASNTLLPRYRLNCHSIACSFSSLGNVKLEQAQGIFLCLWIFECESYIVCLYYVRTYVCMHAPYSYQRIYLHVSVVIILATSFFMFVIDVNRADYYIKYECMYVRIQGTYPDERGSWANKSVTYVRVCTCMFSTTPVLPPPPPPTPKESPYAQTYLCMHIFLARKY